MANGIQFGQAITCDVCEGMCLDAVDGTLTAAEEVAFAKHVAGCTVCAEQLAEAKRGAAWMGMLKGHAPEPPAALLANILARTSGAGTAGVGASLAVAANPPMSDTTAHEWGTQSGGGTAAHEWGTHSGAAAEVFGPLAIAMPAPLKGAAAWTRFAMPQFSGQSHHQPRLALTAAMAFFSIALTMNLTGIRPADLRPSALHRSVADAGANVVRTFQSNRVVYQVETRVSDLREGDSGGDNNPTHDPAGPFGSGVSTSPDRATAPAPQPKRADAPAPHEGSSELQLPSPAGNEQTNSMDDAMRKGA